VVPTPLMLEDQIIAHLVGIVPKVCLCPSHAPQGTTLASQAVSIRPSADLAHMLPTGSCLLVSLALQAQSAHLTVPLCPQFAAQAPIVKPHQQAQTPPRM